MLLAGTGGSHKAVSGDDSAYLAAMRWLCSSAEQAAGGDPPLPAPPVVASPRALIGELFIEILGRIPTGREVQIASGILAPNGKMQPNGVEEFLWSLLVHPEFQYIY